MNGRTVGRKALQLARSTGGAHGSEGNHACSHPKPFPALSSAAGAQVHCTADAKVRPNASSSALRPPFQRLPRQRYGPLLGALCPWKSPSAASSLGCRTPRVHRSTESHGRGSPRYWGCT